MAESYTTVTETPGVGATQEQLSMLYTRYKYASIHCKEKDVLEVACGSGQGLGYLAKGARWIVGGDYTGALIQKAQGYYNGRVPLLRLDAHVLPFKESCFDLVFFYEAIYYLAQPESFLKECRRVLRGKGVLLVCTVNKEWSDFNPSPLSKRYVSAKELDELLTKHGFNAEIFGAFPVPRDTLKDYTVSFLKRTAVASHLIPKTMKGKGFLKRIFFGRLVPLPPEIVDGMAAYVPPEPISCDLPVSDYKVIYAVGRVS